MSTPQRLSDDQSRQVPSAADSTTEPPAYQIEAPVLRATTTRSLADTKRMILANGAFIRPPQKDETAMEVIVCKVHLSRTAAPLHTWRRGAREPRRLGQHYAVLVNRHGSDMPHGGIRIIIEGEPCDTIEEALDWLLERSEVILDEMLARHAHAGHATCCVSGCSRLLASQH